MRRKTFVILAFVLVFALMFTACAARRPLQTPTQQNNRGLNNNNNGMGTGTGATTRRNNYSYTNMGPNANDAYDINYGIRNNAGYNGYGGNYGTNGYIGNNYANNGYGGTNGLGGNKISNGGFANNDRYYNGGTTGTATTQASRLTSTCKRVPGVNDATVVISGNTAYVGVDTAAGSNGRNVAYGNANNVSTIKQQCARNIRTANPQIQKVYVSTDANFLNRLRRVGDGVQNGTAVDSFRDELNGLVRGLMPEKL